MAAWNINTISKKTYNTVKKSVSKPYKYYEYQMNVRQNRCMYNTDFTDF